MDKVPEISIIVPVYNVDKYLDFCLSSIQNQSFKGWECILVDDGSTDTSSMKCDNFAKKDNRFRVFHKENGGQSSARNVALKAARGKFITFVDSDDWVEPDHLQNLYDLILKYEADVAQSGFFKNYRGFKKSKHVADKVMVWDKREIAHQLMKDSKFSSFLWNKLFRKEMITSEFPEGRIYEDYAAMTRWSPGFNKVVSSPKLTYHYRMRKSSSISQNNAVSLNHFLNSIEERANLIDNNIEGIFSGEEKNVFLNQQYIKIAKKIARTSSTSSDKLELVKDISRRLSNMPETPKALIGKKTMKRGSLLRENPEKFIRKMVSVNNRDIFQKFCNSRLYE